MAGTWVRSGTIALTSGSKKVTGTGTAWNSGLNKVTKGCALKHNNIDYEVDYVNSDTELYLVDTYTAATLSGQAYRIQIAVTDTIPELSSRIAQALAYWNGQGANLQALVTGNGNVTLTAPDGTQVTIPSYSNMQPKDALLTALAALTTSADKLVYFTGADTVDQTPLTSFARSLLDDIDAAAARGTLGAQASDTTLTALAGVVTAADKLIYATSVDTFSTATLTAFARTVLAGTDAAAILTTLGASKATVAETNSRLATDRVVTPAGLNAVVPYTPTVNPTLDLDFAKQKYRWYAGAAGLTESSTPSLMTFTRSSIATFFDAMGVMRSAAVDTPRIDYDPVTGECKGLLIEEARTNLLTYSSRFDNAAWTKAATITVKPDATIAPDGTVTADKLVEDTTSAFHYTRQTASVSPSTAYTTSCYMKKSERSVAFFELYDGTTAYYVYFDLSSGVVLSATSGIVASIALSANGFYRCSATLTTGASATTLRVAISPTTGSSAYSYLGDGTSGIYVWGAQLEVGAFPTSHIPSTDSWNARASTATYLDSNGVLQTASSGVARSAAYDYDADGVLQPIGLLLEGAATNLLLYSEQFDNAVWAKSNASITANSIASPDGNTTADKLIESAVSSYHHVSQSATASASTTYTLSAYLKPSERTFARLCINDGVNGTIGAYFNLSTGVVGTTDNSVSARVRKSNNGFWRCEITVTSSPSTTSIASYVRIAAADNVNDYIGDGTSGIYVWGAQLAAGNYATSYIQTTSAQVTRTADTSTSAQATRAADNAVISGTNFSQWHNAQEMTLLSEFICNHVASPNPTRIAQLSDGTESNVLGLFTTTGGLFATTIVSSGTSMSSPSVLYNQVVGKNKAAMSLSASNNIQIAASVSTTVNVGSISKKPINLNTISIGNRPLSGRNINGHIRSLKYFPKALASSELQAMTA